VRILLDYRPALRQRTGVGAYIHETARALAATAPPGESVVLFSASWKDRLAPDAVAPLATVDRRIPVRLLNLTWHRLGWPEVEWITGGRFDVVQAAHPLLVPSRRAARLVTIYDLDFLDHPERTRAEIRRDYAALACSHARRADQVVVISAHTAHGVEHRFGVPPARITICPPGAPDWRPRAAPPSSRGCILFLGTLEPRKNLDVLLEAYSRMVVADPSTPPLVLAGRIGESAASIVQRAQAPPLAGRVELPGYVDEAAKRALFDRALVFVLPSHTEGFGMPVVEAMKAGVPVVVADRGALPETVGDAGTRIDPDDAGRLASVLAGIVGSPERQRQMADAGREQAARFTWTHTASRLREAWALAHAHRAARG
jgi:glycosyltransferase involved in cell wall biosynthesis